MLQHNSTSTRIRHGFTLIELLVVIVVICILAPTLFVVIDPSGTKNSAKDATKKSAFAGIPAVAVFVYNGNDYEYDTVCADSSISSVVLILLEVSVQTVQEHMLLKFHFLLSIIV